MTDKQREFPPMVFLKYDDAIYYSDDRVRDWVVG